MSHDIIFRNATIYDGAGAPGAVGDLALSGGRIAEVGWLGGRLGSL
jgi:N-acyl-D-amino-acid deacylase